MNKTVITAALLPLLFLPGIVLQPSQAQSSQTLDVNVNNFPETQKIKGSVSVEGTMSHSKYIKMEGIVIPTSRRTELSELTFAGILEADGFTSVSVSLQGELKSASFTPGDIGVLLIPDEKRIMRAFRDASRIQFPIESVSRLTSGDSSYFHSVQAHQRIGFPRYRIYLYNTVNRTAETNLYLYLTN